MMILPVAAPRMGMATTDYNDPRTTSKQNTQQSTNYDERLMQHDDSNTDSNNNKTPMLAYQTQTKCRRERGSIDLNE